ncbi:MAG: DNA pilot protein [Microvirus sp.]|nr:MAG: DNA pilot protein [Microvirus sp.]
MSWLSNLAPVLGTGLGALFAAPTGGMSLGMGALIGGATGAGVGSAMAADEANKTNVDLTRETNSTSIELANTAHQREVKDLIAAGLNPILSSKYGGAASPGLTAPSVQSLAPVISSSAAGVRDTAFSKLNLEADLALKRAQIVSTSAQSNKLNTEAVGVAMDNAKKGAGLPADVQAAKNRAWDESSRARRWPWVKAAGVGMKDTGESTLGFLKLVK